MLFARRHSEQLNPPIWKEERFWRDVLFIDCRAPAALEVADLSWRIPHNFLQLLTRTRQQLWYARPFAIRKQGELQPSIGLGHFDRKA